MSTILIDKIRASAPAQANRYAVIDNHTGLRVGDYSSLRRAHNAADKKDLAYGAVRHSVKLLATS